MATWKDFTTQMVQTAVFTPEHSLFAPGKAVATILTNSQARFDGEMQVLPLPAGAPPEIPAVQLRSSDGQWWLSMAPARIDSVWRNPVRASAPNLPDVALWCAQVQERYVGET